MNFLLPILEGLISVRGAAVAVQSARRAGVAFRAARGPVSRSRRIIAGIYRSRMTPRFVRAAMRRRLRQPQTKAYTRRIKQNAITQHAQAQQQTHQQRQANYQIGANPLPLPGGGPPNYSPPTSAQPVNAPQVNYGAMMANMGNPQAHQIAHQQANQQFQQQQQQQAQQNRTQAFDELKRSARNAATALITIGPASRRFADAVSETRRTLAQWNGAVAASFAKLDVEQMHREMRTGRATQVSTVRLNDAVQESRKAWEKFDNAARTIENSIGWVAAKVSTFFGNVMSALTELPVIGDILKKIEEKIGKDTGDQFAGKLIRDLGDGGFEDKARVRPLPPLR